MLLYAGTTSTTTLQDFHRKVDTHVKSPLLVPEQSLICNYLILRISIISDKVILSMNRFSKRMRKSTWLICIRFIVITFGMKNIWHHLSKLCAGFDHRFWDLVYFGNMKWFQVKNTWHLITGRVTNWSNPYIMLWFKIPFSFSEHEVRHWWWNQNNNKQNKHGVWLRNG